ncbi:hypothetical protein BC936DRAFT_139420 [Jimgerdemannia flammicorona]|uniref:DH domain-containing protein n=1 Tax=Jimgerdemannia flammicorona TaxID=994334 RepID=A0A433B9W5_9FUNG|nr:hypothetical protein BC936DRAFT_139420 [Jimgerdemannia flammicorona]
MSPSPSSPDSSSTPPSPLSPKTPTTPTTPRSRAAVANNPLTELIETEKDYVEVLRAIIQVCLPFC